MKIRKAEISEYELLSDLAIKSKAYWGYSKEFLESCRNELSYSQEDLSNSENYFAVAEIENRIVGFYALIPYEKHNLELEALFVDPEFIRKGIGKALLKDAEKIAVQKGVYELIIQGDPFAEKFYVESGCKKIGEKESLSIPGRFLPLFKLSLKGDL